MLTIEEAIVHHYEKANELRQEAEYMLKDSIDYEPCLECANEHEQIAKWLKELKAYKERPQGELIIREGLKEDFIETINAQGFMTTEEIISKIDNAPTVSDRYDEGFRDGYAQRFNDIEERKENNRLFRKGVRKVLSEKPKGKWIKIFENPFTNGYVCPFCGHKIQVTEQFLPEVIECESCGADMRGETNETDN